MITLHLLVCLCTAEYLLSYNGRQLIQYLRSSECNGLIGYTRVMMSSVTKRMVRRIFVSGTPRPSENNEPAQQAPRSTGSII